MKSNEHYSVLKEEAIEGLNIRKDGVYCDLTLGRLGHSKEILKRLNEKGILVGIDCDNEAINYAKENLKDEKKKVFIVKDNFRNIKKILQNLEIDKVDGILFDLGVSSPQFDESYRGFSYRYDGELDMRMDQENNLNARDIVNNYYLNDLVRIFKEYGEEKYSYRIAKKIVEVREKEKINTTFQLVEIVKSSLPKSVLFKDKHPCKQVFQALRIEVNDELNALKEALEDSLSLLNKNGRLVVISFHSLEDRIVKNVFKKVSEIKGDRKNDFVKPSDIKKPEFRLINKKVILPSEKEINENHRSKSAKLRILEKIGD